MINRRASWVAGILLVLFLVIAFIVARVPHAAGLVDAPSAAAFGRFSSPWISAALAVTFLGSAAGTIIAMGLTILYFPTPRVIARLVVAVGGSAAMSAYLKTFFERARPTGALLHVADFSFPSGHATAVMSLYGFIACLAYVRARTRAGKFLAILIPTAVILLVGASRLILGVHYATDVLGGYLLGAAWTAFAFSLGPRIRLR